MKKIVWLLLLCAFTSRAQLSDQAFISVLTCGPYQKELFSAFGHSAFRIYDPVNNIDVACNYGTFDFDQPNFYLNFALGNNLYSLSIQDYPRFQAHYIYENRFIHEQVLNLTADQKQKLFAYLQNNARPENANYLYDYFYDNCSTKIRDVLLAALGKDVVFDESYVETGSSIRELTDLYIKKQQPWGDLGIDICLGLPMDKKATPFEYMFLPDFIELAFDKASIHQNGTTVPLVKQKNIVYETRAEDPSLSLPHPLYVSCLLLLLAIVLTVLNLKGRKTSKWFDVFFFGATGFIGVLLTFLWFFTSHKAAAMNFNLLWAFPFHLVAAIALFRSPAWLEKYFLYTTILLGLTLVLWPILPQDMHYALIPLVIALGVRAFTQYHIHKQKATSK